MKDWDEYPACDTPSMTVLEAKGNRDHQGYIGFIPPRKEPSNAD